MERRGYTKLKSKLSRGNGIDGVWVKYGESGEVVDIVLVEAKYRSKTTNFTKGLLEEDTDGYRQMSNRWLDKKLQAMDKAGGDLEATADFLRLHRNRIRREGHIVGPGGHFGKVDLDAMGID